ncbi:MAG: SDR family NAD(P)-dependent oxidoreductase [Lacipirellulaceae bacterium]
MASLERPVALVTGGAKRVGRAIVEELARRGFSVAIHARESIDDAHWLADELAAEHGAECLALHADLADCAAREGLVPAVLARFGRIDVTVLCAAAWPKAPLEGVTSDDVRRVLEVNTVAPLMLARSAGLAMCDQQQGGVVVLLGDAATAHDGTPPVGAAAYHASKAAIPGLVRALAVELAQRNRLVRAVGVLPGPVLCGDDESPEREAFVRGQSLVGTVGRAEHVAHAVAMLVENPFVNGVSLPVDGGGRLV